MARISMREALEGADVVGRAVKVANNTFRYTDSAGNVRVRLHRTDVVIKAPDGRVTLNSDGWKSVTTRDRMSAYSDYGVSSRGGVWEVARRGDWTKSVPYYDGIVLPDALDSPDADAIAARMRKASRDLKRRVTRFVADHIKPGAPVPVPDSGDCFFCAGLDPAMPREASTQGARCIERNGAPYAGHADHIESHIAESYMPGALIVAAMRDAGRNDFAIRLFAYSERGDRTMVRRDVRKYILKRLGEVTKA